MLVPAELEQRTGVAPAGSAEGFLNTGGAPACWSEQDGEGGRDGWFGRRGDSLEPRLEWAEGLPGGLSVVTGGQMLVGGETWWWHLWKFPLGGFFSPPPPPADKEARSSAVNGGGERKDDVIC